MRKSLKQDVNLSGLKPEMCIVDSIITSVFFENGIDVIISSGTDAHEGRLSLHNVGYALDYRTLHIPSQELKDKILKECKEALPQCDMMIHGPVEHLHVEYDPKDNIEFQKRKELWKNSGGKVW